MTPILELKNIDYSYHTLDGETKALSNIHFHLRKGSLTAVVGPSGCGKSTLLSLIDGLMKPESGDLLITGILQQNSSKIGYMLQHDLSLNGVLYTEMSFSAQRSAGSSHRKLRRRAEEMLEQYGLKQFARSKPSELSGGMRQRAALIRTLLLEPELAAARRAVLGPGLPDTADCQR